MDKKERELRIALVRAGQRALADRLVWGSAGNFSVRHPTNGKILITPSDVEYTDMLPEDIVTINLQGERLKGELQPSFEAKVHCAVYRARPDVEAIAHTEPEYVNAFGIARMDIPVAMHNLKKIKTSVPIGPCMASGSDLFAQEMLRIMGDQNAVIWPNHGLLVVDTTIYGALKVSWRIENNAKVFLLAKILGEPHVLPDDYHSLEE